MNIKPRFAIVSIFIAVAIYLYLGMMILGSTYSPGIPILLFVLYLLFIMLISYNLLKNDIEELNNDQNNFNKKYPFEKYGSIVHSFQYSFKADSDNIINETFK